MLVPPARRSVDLVVIDSTPGGLCAAIAARRHGLSVIVVTEDRHIGGMQTAGLGNTNTGLRATIGGLPREFHDRIRRHYERVYGADSPQFADSQDGFHFESSVAEAVYEQWLAELDCEVIRGRHPTAVHQDGARIRAIELDDGSRIDARWFIDASYEGDLVSLAGCATIVGRESIATYDEPLAGIRYPASQFGQADAHTQAYDYRLCLTANAANQRPFRQPAHYDPARYDDWRQHFQRKALPALSHVIPLNMMPNGKTDSRAGEWVGGCLHYPRASRDERRQIAAAHREYAEGWLWFLLTDPVIPAVFRDELRHWGYAADEFADNDNWPYHLYVRESIRLQGDWIMTQHDVQHQRFQPDSVGLGSFYLDVHPVRCVAAEDDPDRIVWDGHLDCTPLRPYEIPYRLMLPRMADADNLWSLFVLSASHVAYSTLRMEPYFMMLGQAAGTAAALLHGSPTARSIDLPAADLQADLLAHHAILAAADFPDYWPHPPA